MFGAAVFSEETSRTCLNSQSEGAETASRKIIKPDLALFASNSFEVRVLTNFVIITFLITAFLPAASLV